MDEDRHPTVAAMAADGLPFRVVLVRRLRITKAGPKLISNTTALRHPNASAELLRRSDSSPALDPAGALWHENFDPALGRRRPLSLWLMETNGYRA